MIIACPVCTTGFNLPTERISAKGVKLRCSKCGHVFRVRLDMANEPEIFYKPGEEPAPQATKSTQIGFPLDTSDEPDPKTIDLEPHLKGAPDFFADFDAKPEPKPIPDDPFKPDAPQAVDASEEIFNNLTSLSGLSSPNEQSLNLFDDASGFGTDNADDPFGGAFDVDEGEFDPFTEFSQAQDDSALGDEEAPMLMAGQPGMAGLKPTASPEPQAAPIKEEPKLKNAPKDDEDFWSSGGAGVFGGADDMVDPNFGATDFFDATAAQPAQAAQPAAQPAPAPVPKPQARPAPQQERIRLANEPDPKPARAQAPPEDTTSPHKIGGSGAQKAANFVLIVMLVLVGFLGLVGVLNDGMIDFKNFGHMLEVAFSGKPYQPRAEWRGGKSTPTTPTTNTTKGDNPQTTPSTAPTNSALSTHHVTMERIKVSKRGAVLVVRGKVTNNTDKQIAGAKLSVRVINREGNDLAKGEALSGVALSTKVIKKAKTLEKIQAKLPKAPVAIDAKTEQIFTVVLDSPAENSNDAPVTYKVEVQPAL